MKKIYIKTALIVIAFLILPRLSYATAVEKTFTGTVIRVGGSQVIFKAGNGATFGAEISGAKLVRKFGAGMQFSEITIGDKIEVKGILWEDNSISASFLRNMSLYVHNGTFSAKVISTDPAGLNFSMQSRTNGIQTVHTDSLTIFKKNSGSSSLSDIEAGMTVTAKGTWERNNSIIFAKTVTWSVRLINIAFTGVLKARSDARLSVMAGGNTFYAVDTETAKLLSKNGKPINISELNMDDNLKITGKHRSEDVRVTASQVKDMSISK